MYNHQLKYAKRQIKYAQNMQKSMHFIKKSMKKVPECILCRLMRTFEKVCMSLPPDESILPINSRWAKAISEVTDINQKRRTAGKAPRRLITVKKLHEIQLQELCSASKTRLSKNLSAHKQSSTAHFKQTLFFHQRRR